MGFHHAGQLLSELDRFGKFYTACDADRCVFAVLCDVLCGVAIKTQGGSFDQAQDAQQAQGFHSASDAEVVVGTELELVQLETTQQLTVTATITTNGFVAQKRPWR